jgi:hypothetical protein
MSKGSTLWFRELLSTLLLSAKFWVSLLLTISLIVKVSIAVSLSVSLTAESATKNRSMASELPIELLIRYEFSRGLDICL